MNHYTKNSFDRVVFEGLDAKKEIISFADRRKDIKDTQDYFRIRADKYSVIGELQHSRNVFVISGYIPEEDCEKLERLCEENGILLTKVAPAYTSQACSNCGTVDKNSRKNEQFSCQHCGYEIDADYTASINIRNMGKCKSHNFQKGTKSLA